MNMLHKRLVPYSGITIVLLVAVFLGAEPPADPFGRAPDAPAADPFGGLPDAPPAGELGGATADPVLMKLMDEEERKITIRQANLFHREFMARCVDDLPLDVGFQYRGPLTVGSSRKGQRVEGEPAGVLEWCVYRNVVLFSFWISTVRTHQTVAKRRIEGTAIFVNISFTDENRSLDEAFPELGGRSVRDVVSRLEGDRCKSK
jgi:hypothetical protein